MPYEKILHAVADPLALAALALLLTIGLIGAAYRGLPQQARSRQFTALMGVGALFVVGAFALVALQLGRQMWAEGGTTQLVRGEGNAISRVGGNVGIGNCAPESMTDKPASTTGQPAVAGPQGRVEQHVESGNAITDVGGNVKIQQPTKPPPGQSR